MPATIQAALLGIVQGLTEFLPVSSSAHLILARAFFGWDADVFGLPFDVALHAGTLAAVIAFFWSDVVATIHDLLVTLAFLAFFRYDLSLNVLAAILTVTGYSTNDTIVIFDRVRENMRSMRRDSLYDVVNASVNQTMSRTVITAGTALLSALALFFFGGDVLHGFAFTMIVGIITGTYSSVFIASAIAIIWQGRSKSAGALSKQAPEPVAARARKPTRRRAS